MHPLAQSFPVTRGSASDVADARGSAAADDAPSTQSDPITPSTETTRRADTSMRTSDRGRRLLRG
jgi:hypothetical protein